MKKIVLSGWWLSFEKECEYYIKYEQVSGFNKIHKIEIEGESQSYKESDFIAIDKGNKIFKFLQKDAIALEREKKNCSFSFEIDALEFNPQKLKFYYIDVIIKIGEEEIRTGNKILWSVTYNGKKCQLKWECNIGDINYRTIIWYKSPFIYDYCAFGEGLVAVELNDWYYFIDTTGKKVFPDSYKRAENFKNGLAPIFTQKTGWGFINQKGEEVIATQYNDVHHFNNGRAFIQKENLFYFGFIDENGKEIIPCKYRRVWDGIGVLFNHDFNEELVLVGNDEFKCGYIDKVGEVVVPLIYSSAHPFCEGLGAVRKNGKWGFVDKLGNEVIHLIYSDVYDFSEGFAAVKLDGKWGFIDKTNKEVIPCIYNNVYSFSEGLSAVKIGHKWGFIDKFGERVIDCKYTDITLFQNGLAAVKMKMECGYKWGYVDMQGNFVIPCMYDLAESFHTNGLACVEINKKWGCINRYGDIVVPLIYDDINIYETLFVVGLNGKYGLLDINGQPIEDHSVYKELSKKYDQVFLADGEEKTYTFALNGKYGLTDKDGNVLIPAEYDWMGKGFEYEDNTLMIVGKKDGFYEYINRQGEKFDKKKK